MEEAPRPKAIQHTIWCVEVFAKDPRPMAINGSVSDAVLGLPGKNPIALIESRVFYIRGALNQTAATEIARWLLCDRIVEQFSVGEHGSPRATATFRQSGPFIEILPKPGVMDPVALSAERAIRDLGFGAVDVRTGRRFICQGNATPAELRCLAERTLANPVVEDIHCFAGARDDVAVEPFVEPSAQEQELRSVVLRNADDAELLRISRDGHLFLNLNEMQAIRAHYHAVGREPTDLELETLAQTWSEHCGHKTLKSEVHYCGAPFPTEIGIGIRTSDFGLRASGPDIERVYTNLLADTIVRATHQLDKPWCLSVFKDNAGIIEFDERFGVAFKVETHNHPSALEPYGGAATGIGGCIRDIMGCGLGAKPIANTNVFCFADPSLPPERVPTGVIHPARTMREVVRGVRDYGNRMGIPTVNGAIVFDDRYLGNPLVYVGCVGVLPKDRIAKSPSSGDRIVVVGGRTGRDGIHGATFSSGSLTDTHAEEFAHAVQIGNAITQKKVLDVLLRARDQAGGCLYSCITDCGAGGLSSAVGEMACELGAVVELDRVPLKYAGLRYDEIWISEAQERMVLAVPPAKVEELIALFRSEDVEATDIGSFSGDGQLVLKYSEQEVGRLDTDFLHNGLPKSTREATWSPTTSTKDVHDGVSAEHLHAALLDRLSQPNIASKEWVIRQYDHEVQGGSVIKPLMGPGRGPSDAAVVRPLPDSLRGVVLSCGLCSGPAELDPYVMAIASVDEAVRNNLCVGGNIERMALLDNFCWGGVASERELGTLVRAAQGCHDAAMAYGVPFISGKDSLNNVFELQPAEAGRMGWPVRISIPDTLLISAISVVADVRTCRSSDLKEVGNKLMLARPTGRCVVDLAGAARAICLLLRDRSAIRSCHDVSEGGWLVAAAEMTIGSKFGLQLESNRDCFSDQLGCYLLEVAGEDAEQLSDCAALEFSTLGTVIKTPKLILSEDGPPVVWDVDELRRAWRSTFDWG